MYVVLYECDALGNHTAPVNEICEINKINFNDALQALIFIQECTTPITRESEICPWIAENAEMFTINEQTKEVPLSRVRNAVANIHLVMNNGDFKTLI